MAARTAEAMGDDKSWFVIGCRVETFGVAVVTNVVSGVENDGPNLVFGAVAHRDFYEFLAPEVG